MNNENFRKCTYPKIMPNRYFISENGKVYDFLREKFLKPFLHHTGYYYISLTLDPKYVAKGKKSSTTVQIHRLVAWQFVDNPNNNPVVDHLDGDKFNNHYTNLEWVTIAENVRRASNNNLLNGVCYGEEKVREVCGLLQDGYSVLEVYRKFMNDEYARVCENEKLYIFIDRIKKKESWKTIVEEYDFSKSPDSAGDKKAYKVQKNGKYSEELIREICSFLQEGWSSNKIYYHYYPKAKDLHDNWSFYTLIQGLRRRRNWDYITKDYNYTMESTRCKNEDRREYVQRKRIRESDAYNYFLEGYSLKEVKRLLEVTPEDKQKNTKRYQIMINAYEKYRQLKELSEKENITIAC